jgi:hypothetical protein
MTPIQKIQHLIINLAFEFKGETAPPVSEDNVEDLYDEIMEEDEGYDAKSEIREGIVKTGQTCYGSRHYESESVAAQAPDGTWVGWIYWSGGGKHGEPEEMEWMNDAYDLNCKEEEKMTVHRTFTKI